MMRLALITDEFSQDLNRVLQFVKETTIISGLELRSIFGKALHELDNSVIKEIGAVIRKEGFLIPCIASPLLSVVFIVRRKSWNIFYSLSDI